MVQGLKPRYFFATYSAWLKPSPDTKQKQIPVRLVRSADSLRGGSRLPPAARCDPNHDMRYWGPERAPLGMTQVEGGGVRAIPGLRCETWGTPFCGGLKSGGPGFVASPVPIDCGECRTSKSNRRTFDCAYPSRSARNDTVEGGGVRFIPGLKIETWGTRSLRCDTGDGGAAASAVPDHWRRR